MQTPTADTVFVFLVAWLDLCVKIRKQIEEILIHKVLKQLWLL